MKTAVSVLAVVLLVAAVVFVIFSNVAKVKNRGERLALEEKQATALPVKPVEAANQPVLTLKRPLPPEPAASAALSAGEKAARMEKVKRDYDEIRTKAAAEYGAAGAAFPGGLNAYLRQLALLEREKRADMTAILTPGELEDWEMRETPAGQLVQRLLGATNATEEQRRAAFRLQREFDDRFALAFDATPEGLREREAARQQTQEKIRVAIGDELFDAWVAAEGPDYASFAAYAAKQNLPASTALDLWRAKNEFALRRLDVAANRELTSDQRAAAQKALIQQTEIRVMDLIGPGALQTTREDMLRWLPRK